MRGTMNNINVCDEKIIKGRTRNIQTQYNIHHHNRKKKQRNDSLRIYATTLDDMTTNDNKLH